MSEFKGLFRQEVIEAKSSNWLGAVVLLTPVSSRVVSAVLITITLSIVAYLYFGSYTKRTTVIGQLTPTTGLVKIHTPQAGVVLERKVEEGQRVRKGDILYVLSSERQSITQGNTQEKISGQVEKRVLSLKEELERTQQLQDLEQESLRQRIRAMATELEKANGQISVQKARVDLSQETLARYELLLKQDYISREQLQQKQEELLDQRNRLQAFERDRLAISRDLTTQKNDLKNLQLKQPNQVNQIQRSILSSEQELAESEAKRILLISATSDGIATATTAEVGQVVDGSKPLLALVPENDPLVAHLYAQSKSIGFIKTGDAVVLRYQAYPYQKFGHAKGEVQAISKVNFSQSELPAGTITTSVTPTTPEPYYRITVQLNSQYINTYGHEQRLQAGMVVEGDILQDRRRIYEWLFEPILSLRGKLES